MKKRILAFIAVALSVLFVLPMVGPIVTFAAGVATTSSVAQYVSEERNVALYKTVTVSDNQCLNNDQWKPEKLTDGTLDAGLHLATTEGNHNFDITADNPVDITVNLQGRYAISKVVLDIPSQYSWRSLPKEYTVQFSTDGEHWTDVYTVTNGHDIGHMEMDIPADKNVTSYVRLHITDDNTKIHSEDLHNLTAIGELEAWGVSDSSWNQAPSYVDNNPAAADTRAGTLKYIPSEDGKTVSISYYDPAAKETKTYTVPNNDNYLFGGYAGVDDLGRSLSEAGQNGVTAIDATQEKYIGLFYFLWHGLHDYGGNDVIGKAYDLQKQLEANGGYSYGTVGGSSDMHWFSEPLYGYYTGADRYVMRKHAELLTNAGVDFLYFDITNNFSYTDRALVLMEILHEMNEQGYDAPQVVFYTNTDSLLRVREIYADIYSKNLYPDTWFCIDGKPVVVTRSTIANDQLVETDPSMPTVGEFFTMKSTQWPNDSMDDYLPGNMTSTNNAWPWMDFHWPQRVYTDANGENGAISVSAAQHSGTTKFSDSATKNGNRYYYNRGRSFQANGTKTNNTSYSALDTSYNSNAKNRWNAWNNDNSLSNYGYNFQEQFDYALTQTNVKYILVTGWNEWVATNVYGQTSDTAEDAANAPTKAQFVDAASVEFSRDLEMAKGYYFDNYYMQLVSNIQKAKGTAPYIIQDQRYPINVTGSFDQWNNIVLTYTDPAGDPSVRYHKAYGETGWTMLSNTTGRNDIVASKITSDTKNVYFYVETADAITPASADAWMQVYVNVDRNATTGWYGYDYIINYAAESQSVTSVAKYTGTNNAYQFEVVDTVAYQVSQNKMMIEVPLSLLGITDHNAVNFEFKIVDGAADMTTMESFYTDGDVAPLGRLNYIYHGRTTDALDPASNDAAPDEIPVEVKKEYVKEEGFDKLWGTESTSSTYQGALNTNESQSVGVRVVVPANITLTDFSSMFTSITNGTKITLRVYRWAGSQSASVSGVVLFEQTKECRATAGSTACTVVVNLPDADSNRAITDGDYFFVWSGSSGKTYGGKSAVPSSGSVTTVESYVKGTKKTNNGGVRASVSYVKTTETEVTPVDKSLYTQVSQNKAHIILLGGQSNGSGSTPYNDLALHDSANIKKYNEGFSNVQIYYHNDGTTTNNNSGGVFVPVSAAYGACQGGNVHAFGIEVGLAAYLAETYPGETFYIIKSGIGGSMLTSNAADASATYWLNNGSTEGAAWTNFKNAVNNATALLADKGLEPEIFAMIWMQGESDANNKDNAANYLTNMNSFMAQVESALPAQYVAANGIAFLDIAIATNATWNYPAQVNAAKRQFAAANQNRYYLDMTHLDCFDAAHYIATDMIRLGKGVGETITTVLNRCNYVPKMPSTEAEAVRYNVAYGKSASGVMEDGSAPGVSVFWHAGDGAPWTWQPVALTDGIYGEYLPSSSPNGPLFRNGADGTPVGRQFWIMLQGTFRIDEIRLYAWTWVDWAGNSTFPSAFSIEIGTPDGGWVTVVDDAGHAGRTVESGALCYSFDEVTGDRIRFTVKGASAVNTTALGELEAWGYDVEPTYLENAALNKGVTMTPAENALQWGHVQDLTSTWDPYFMTDGTVMWTGQGLYLCQADLPDLAGITLAPRSDTEIVIPLGKEYDLYRFELYPFQYSGGVPQGYGLPRGYTIYYSVDGDVWEEAVSVDAEGDDRYAVELGAQKLYLESVIRARYLKIVITKYASIFGEFSGIGEFRAMGTEVPGLQVPSDATNVALGSDLTIYPAGSTYNVPQDGWFDAAMVDGLVPAGGGLYFLGYDGTVGTSPRETREITLDLGGKFEVYSYELHGFIHNQNGDFGYPTAYTIYTSPDKGSTWEEAYTYVYDGFFIWTPAHTATFKEAKTATHIKLVMTEWSRPEWNEPIPCGIGEFVVYGVSLEDDNVAKGKTATVSGGTALGAASDGWGVQFVTDGLTPFNTGASSGMLYNNGGGDGAADGSKITIDLNGTYSIYAISVVNGYTTPQFLPPSFDLLISTDGGSSYTTVVEATGVDVAAGRLTFKLDKTYTGVTHVQMAITASTSSALGGYTCVGEIEVNGVVEKVAGVTASPDVTNKLTATAKPDSSHVDYPSTNLTDGDTSATTWRSNRAASKANPVSVIMELEAVYEVNSLVLYSGSTGTSSLPYAFTIEVSTNGYAWNTVYTYEGLAATAVAGQAFVASFSKTYAKYVRLSIIDDSTLGYSEIAEMVVCGTAHSNHVYSEKVATVDHLMTAATCSSIGVYYVSCPCGNNGTTTFTAGGYAAHNYVNVESAELLQAANCSIGNVYAKQCSACGKKGGGVFTDGATTAHDFTNHEAHSNYMISDKTCANYATYYCSCVTCNLQGADSFEYVEGGKAPHAEDAGVYDKTTGERTYHCDNCSNVRTVGVEFSMNVILGTDLDVNYYAFVDAEATNPVLNIEVPGKETMNASIEGVLYGTTEDGRNIYVFTYANVGPQHVSTTVNLSLSCDDNTVHQKAHAVEEYIEDVKSSSSNEKEVAAADALMVYADAARRVVTSDSSIEVDVSNFTNVATTDKAATNNGVFAFVQSATVWFASINHIRYTVKIADGVDFADLTFKVKVNGGAETVVAAENIVKRADNSLYIYTDGIEAAHFDDVYTLTVYNGEEAGLTVSYSVNSYAYTMQANGEGVEVNHTLLAKALYLYGMAAKNLAQ